MSPALAGGFFTTNATWEAQINYISIKQKKKRLAATKKMAALATLQVYIILQLQHPKLPDTVSSCYKNLKK